MLSSAMHEESLNSWYLIFYRQNKFHSQVNWVWKKGFITAGPVLHSLNEKPNYVFLTGKVIILTVVSNCLQMIKFSI